MSLDGFIADRDGDLRPLRLLERIGAEQRQLDTIEVIKPPARTDIRYRLVR
jgi:hypothetical protein